jgi:hypothetical protein
MSSALTARKLKTNGCRRAAHSFLPLESTAIDLRVMNQSYRGRQPIFAAAHSECLRVRTPKNLCVKGEVYFARCTMPGTRLYWRKIAISVRRDKPA